MRSFGGSAAMTSRAAFDKQVVGISFVLRDTEPAQAKLDVTQYGRILVQMRLSPNFVSRGTIHVGRLHRQERW